MTAFQSRYKGIIFDMDNTILRSRIQFPAMKQDVFRLLLDYEAVAADFPIHNHTIATLLESTRGSGKLTGEQERAVWQRVAEWEREGMENAGLEPEALELLNALRDRFRLVILTNNAHQAALEALETTGTLAFFDTVVGREQMGVLKPSPAGIHYIRALFPALSAHEWLSVGDAWIDGSAAQQAGVDFIRYRSRDEEFFKRDIPSLGRLDSLLDLLRFL
ncbi:HAD family hydrolase [Paenibacillus sp. HJGM_3]|uniref:HAD family hydrolase n=1 Tax=Paenibacillus sp. HJGM_3 TaxID=3379816 RepID=UPI00385ED0F0